MSSLFPRLAEHADDLCVLNGMHTDLPNHSQAFLQYHTGSFQVVRPSIGAWTLYGLGSENENLPGFVVLVTGQVLGAGNSAWGSGFLPSIHQGVKFRGQGDPVLYLQNPDGLSSKVRRGLLDDLAALNVLSADEFLF